MSQNSPGTEVPQEAYGCDTDQLLIIHAIYRNAFGRAPDLIENADASDPERVKFIADHLKEYLISLHNHHAHEDILWWETLKQRAPESTADVERMQRHHAEIAERIEQLIHLVDAWTNEPRKKPELKNALTEFKALVLAHLDDEEANIRPVAGRVMTQKEWDKASELGVADIPRERMMPQLGYMLRCAPTDELRQKFLSQIPFIARLLYNLSGKRKAEAEWRRLYGQG